MIRSSSLDKLFASALTQVEDVRIRAELELIMSGNDDIVLPDELTDPIDEEIDIDEEEEGTLAAQIREMSIPHKVKLALTGNKLARGLLIRDNNWMVASFVLENGQLTEGEVQEFAKNANLDQLVFRAIASRADWMRSYATKASLVSNPKTPVDVSIKWLKHLKDKDLRNLSKSKGVPQVITTQSRKLVEKRSKK